jgi:hypothetical protein
MDAVATATAAVQRLYRLNSVPASPVYPYGSFSASMGRGGAYTLDGDEGLRWGRVVVQTFGRTADSAVDHAEQIRAALAGTRLTLSGFETTACRAELDPAVTRDPDDSGVVGVTTTYTFTAAPTT